MFGFGKTKGESKKKKRSGEATDLDPSVAERIHVMPERFYAAPKKNRAGTWILIGGGLLLVIGLAVAAFYLNEDLKRNRENQQPPVNTQPIVPAPVTPPVNVSTTTDVINAPIATSTPETATSTDTNINVSVPMPGVQPLPSAIDADSDNLTEAEEQLYGTNASVSDTDGDTFSDGAELLSGYDPTRQRQSLSTSTLVRSYTHARYTILHPASWTVRERGSDGSEVLFLSPDGEYVEVLVIANPNQQVLPDWYRAQFPNINVNDLMTVRVGNLSGLRAPDERSYYFADPVRNDVIYLITYNVGNRTVTNYATTFNLMVKNFLLLP